MLLEQNADWEDITIEITNRCDLQCKMCSIWQEREKRDLSLENIKKIIYLAKKPISVSLTGGEPFLHPQFTNIYRYLFKLYLQKRIRGIDITTNGYSDFIPEFLKTNRNFLTPLTIDISLDGLSIAHNKQRGNKDAFEKTIRNINITKTFVPLSLKFTITPLNYKDMFKVYQLSRKLRCDFHIKLAEKVPNYYHREFEPRSILKFSKSQKEETVNNLASIYKLEIKRNKKINNLGIFSLTCLINFMTNRNMSFIKKCLVPQKSLFLTSRGDIHSCIYYKPLGNLKDREIDFRKNRKIIDEAINGNCPKCLSYHGYLREFNIKTHAIK